MEVYDVQRLPSIAQAVSQPYCEFPLLSCTPVRYLSVVLQPLLCSRKSFELGRSTDRITFSERILKTASLHIQISNLFSKPITLSNLILQHSFSLKTFIELSISLLLQGFRKQTEILAIPSKTLPTLSLLTSCTKHLLPRINSAIKLPEIQLSTIIFHPPWTRTSVARTMRCLVVKGATTQSERTTLRFMMLSGSLQRFGIVCIGKCCTNPIQQEQNVRPQRCDAVIRD